MLDLLRRHGVRPGRRLGQHFLGDRRLLERIVAALDAPAGAAVLEVGPGLGTLTRALLDRGARVMAVEIDRALRAPLLEVLGPYPVGAAPAIGPAGLAADVLGPRLTLLWADAVRLPWGALAGLEAGPWRLCSNLPYYVTGPFLASFLLGPLPWSDAVLLVQAEAAQRMGALPGTKAYGAFSCLVQYHAGVEVLFRVPRGAFVPPPDVDSVVVRLRPRARPPVATVRDHWLRVVRAAFGQRRKTLRNALAAGLGLEATGIELALQSAGIDGARRAETLSLEDFGRVADALAQAGRVEP